jgi:hypothetical protein
MLEGPDAPAFQLAPERNVGDQAVQHDLAEWRQAR